MLPTQKVLYSKAQSIPNDCDAVAPHCGLFKLIMLRLIHITTTKVKEHKEHLEHSCNLGHSAISIKQICRPKPS